MKGIALTGTDLDRFVTMRLEHPAEGPPCAVLVPFDQLQQLSNSVCSNRLIPEVLHEWREPRHDAFEGRNVWSLFNAFTESLKDGNLAELPKRTEALHGLLDTHVGLSA